MFKKDTKYLIAYLAPLAAFAGIYYAGIWSLGAMYVGFVLIPILEIFAKGTQENFSEPVEATKKEDRFFDVLLYLNLPILYALIVVYLLRIEAGGLSSFEILGMTLSVGLVVGTVGINVAHELGHRTTWYEQLMAKSLLLSALYMHFFIEHNRGHHKNVATEKDPATSRQGEAIYFFWIRSVFGSYWSAWKLEYRRLTKTGRSAFSWSNEMLRFQVIQLVYLFGMGLLFGWDKIPYLIGVAVTGFLLLESVNYIEHYGLRRKLLENGRYETVKPQHSWNSNKEFGRIFLYELTRHSDHHFKASRKYQVLRHFDESPQLPYGYPTSMLIALIPPLWFKLMDKQLQRLQTA